MPSESQAIRETPQDVATYQVEPYVLAAVVRDLLRGAGGPDDDHALRETFARTTVLSSDVVAGVNPLFPEVHELQNAPRLGGGVALTKYTGHHGKLNGSDASAELVARITTLARTAGVALQSGTLGRVDEGGGGTIAQYLAERGMNVVDVGIGVLSMHSPFELAHKADLWALYRLSRAFFSGP